MRSKKEILNRDCKGCNRPDQTFGTNVEGRLTLVANQLQCQVCLFADILEVMVDIRDLLKKG